jgi:hypothetical protein
MKDVTVRQLEMVKQVVGFLEGNPIAFSKNSRGASLVEQLQQQVAQIQSLTATQATEIAQARADSRTRSAARESLNTAMGRINRTAQAMAITMPELESRFETTRRIGDAKLETCARSMAESAGSFVKEFVEFEMSPKFLSELESKIKRFTEAIADHKASRSAHVATSQLIDAAMKRALIILAQLDPIMENKLGENMGLQLRWENVRRIERRWISRTPKATEPETNATLIPAA